MACAGGTGRRLSRLPPKSAAACLGDRPEYMRQLCLRYARAHRQRLVERLRTGDELGEGQMVLDAVGPEWDAWEVDELVKLDARLELERVMYAAAMGDCDPKEDCIDAQLAEQCQAEEDEVAYYAAAYDGLR
eukprot:TRINITY_DN1116_c0_g2_i1.p2 TRINITY_DN1116_c0_g2~~TRINITY_DN1116_c0_g2_i1.p2  ORF type:complete len:132 (+),score=42.14 TRINITY_DN1116_c0_g2_i1:84-479(+)